MPPATITLSPDPHGCWRIEITRHIGEQPFVVIVAHAPDAHRLVACYRDGVAAALERPPRSPFSVP